MEFHAFHNDFSFLFFIPGNILYFFVYFQKIVGKCLFSLIIWRFSSTTKSYDCQSVTSSGFAVMGGKSLDY